MCVCVFAEKSVRTCVRMPAMASLGREQEDRTLSPSLGPTCAPPYDLGWPQGLTQRKRAMRVFVPTRARVCVCLCVGVFVCGCARASVCARAFVCACCAGYEKARALPVLPLQLLVEPQAGHSYA